MDREFRNEADSGRYALYVNGEQAVIINYVINGGVIALTRTLTQPAQRGHGYAGELVAWVINDIETNTALRVTTTCSYIEHWFETHPERAGVLHRNADTI